MSQPNAREVRLTVPELAGVLDVGLTTARKLVKSRKVGSYKIEGLVFVPESEVNDYLSRQFRPAIDREKLAKDLPHQKSSAIARAAQAKNGAA